MRKILLAGAAMLATTGMAMAVVVVPTNTDSVSVSTTVAQACTVDITATTVTLPADATPSSAVPFTFTCNFTGTTAALTYTSSNGGAGSSANPYNIITAVGDDGVSTTPLTTGSLVTTALTAVPNSFTLQLQAPILVAGTYADTLTVSVAP